MTRRHRRRPRFEGLESRRLLSVTIAEYPTSGSPGGVVAAPDGNIWFTQGVTGGTTEIVVYNPTTQTSTIVPFAGGAITLGPDGNIWSIGAQSLASINPTTHAITTIPLPAGVNGDGEIARGPGNDLAFVGTNSSGSTFEIGLIDATTHAITIDSTGLQAGSVSLTFNSINQLAAGPDGNV
jgi:sugar lactone lactonase YvrE